MKAILLDILSVTNFFSSDLLYSFVKNRSTENCIIKIRLVPNAPHAAAVRALADFIFVFRFHFSSHNHFPYRQTPH